MDKRKFFALFSVISTSALAMAVVFAAKPDISNLTLMSRGANTYSCNDIVFSETVNNPGSYTDIPDLSAEGVTTLNCSMTEWTNANYLKTCSRFFLSHIGIYFVVKNLPSFVYIDQSYL